MVQSSPYILVHIACRNSPIPKKDLSSFLFVGVAIFSIFSLKAWSGDIPSFEMVEPKNVILLVLFTHFYLIYCHSSVS